MRLTACIAIGRIYRKPHLQVSVLFIKFGFIIEILQVLP